MNISVKRWTWTKRKAICLVFLCRGFDYAIGIYSGFPLFRPFSWRERVVMGATSWQLDIFWFSLAKKARKESGSWWRNDDNHST